MTFEKALEAMKQGKKVRRRAWADWDKSKMIFLKGDYFYWGGEEDIGVALTLDFLEADDWEIYEEPQKEHGMTAGHAIEVLESVRRACKLIPDIDEAIDFAMETIDKQNQQELVFDPENLSQKELEEVQEKLKEYKLEVKPEKKCDCECNSGDENLQEEMKETLSRKFFELDRIEKDSLAVSNMLDIYRLLFEVKP